MSQLKKSINTPTVVMLTSVPILGNSRNPIEEITIINIPTKIDQMPIVRPSCLKRPICKTSQEPTPKNCPLTVRATPSPKVIKPIKKTSHRMLNSLLMFIHLSYDLCNVELFYYSKCLITIHYFRSEVSKFHRKISFDSFTKDKRWMGHNFIRYKTSFVWRVVRRIEQMFLINICL